VRASLDFSRYLYALDPGHATLELEALARRIRFHSGALLQEIEMPKGAAELTIGDALEADGFLLGDQFPDGPIFGLPQLFGRDLATLALRSGVPQMLGTEQAANVIRPKRGSNPQHQRQYGRSIEL